MLISLFLFVGCAKREATKVIAQAETAKEEARSAQAPGYAQKEFNDASNLLNLASQQFESGDYQQAIETAQKAESRFIAAREVVPVVRRRVQGQLDQIEEALSAAEGNVQKARDGNVLQPEEINPIAEQVSQLRTEKIDTYDRETDEEKLNNFLARVKEILDQTESLATAHLKPQAADAKAEIQKMLTSAQELKADVHLPEKYGQVMELWRQLETAERDGQWQEVIDNAARIKTPLNEIIVAAQEKSAGDILADLEKRIQQAEALNVQGVDAFAAAIQQAKQSLRDGHNELANQQYASAIAASDNAKEVLAQGYQALGQEARALIKQAQTHLQEAIAEEAETYAPAVISQIREAVAGVEQLLQNERYVDGYAAARRAQQIGSQAVQSARRGKGQASLSTVEKPFSLLYGQGGATYAPEAYQEAFSVVQDLRNKMKQDEIEAVVEGSPAAAAVVNQAIVSLAKAANEFIQKAQTALDEANTAKASDWVPMQYANSINLKSAAVKELEQDRYLSCIRNAEQSINAAKEAEAKAYQLQTEQNLRKADEWIAVAKRAEQDRLSPLAYREAVQAVNESTELYKKQQFKMSYQSSVEALAKSDRALNNLVLTAKESADSALQAESMTYSQPEIEKALALLNEAEVAQKAEQFSVANQYSIDSAKLAEEAEYFTWKQRSYALLRQLEGSREELEYHLAPVKKPVLFREFVTNLAEAQVMQIDQDYKQSYAFADKARNAKESVWESMNEDLTQQVLEMSQMAEWIGENALDEGGRDIKISLLDALTGLERQIGLQDWRQAYAEADKAWDITHKSSQGLEGRNRKILASQLNASLNPYDKQNALDIVPEQAQLFNDTIKTLNKPTEGQTYGEVYEKFQTAQQAVEQLPESIVDSASQRRDEIASILQQAQDAGASKYYGDWFRTLSSDLQWLRNSIRSEDYQGIASRLKKLEKEANELLLATMNAVAEDNYFQLLDNNLTQMNNLIQQFGTIGNMPSDLIIMARATEHKLDEMSTDMYRSLQGEISVKTLRVSAEILEERIKEMKPPAALAKLHKKAIASFTHFRKAADGFEMYGNSKTHDLYFRERALRNAYEHLYKVLDLNADLEFYAKGARKLDRMEKIQWTINSLEQKFANFYYSYTIR